MKNKRTNLLIRLINGGLDNATTQPFYFNKGKSMTNLKKKYDILMKEVQRPRMTRRDEQKWKRDVEAAAKLLWLEIEFRFAKEEKDKE